MGLDNVSQTNYIADVAQQIAKKNTVSAPITPRTKQDTVELSTKAP